MKSALSGPGFRWFGWAVALSTTLVLLAGAVLPPLVGGEWAAAVRSGFGSLCHQLPSRSFALDGVPFAVCHRCTGIFAGLTVGALLVPAFAASERLRGLDDRVVILIALAPVLADWGGDVLGVWANTSQTRTLSGAWFGLAAGFIYARALAFRPGKSDTVSAGSGARRSASVTADE